VISPIRLRPGRTAVYLLALSIVYLAGVYLGGTLLVVWYAMLLLPLFSLAQMIATRVGLRYHQEFSNDHPAKGEAVGYYLSVTNETRVPSAPITASFHMGRVERGLDTRRFQLRAHETRNIDQSVRCPYRGVYTVGLDRLVVWDLFGWIGFTVPVFSRTFYVYPRVLSLPSALPGFETEHAVAQSPSAGVEIDYTLYRSLRPYRPEDDARHISWRKLAAVGEPLVKEYDTAAEPGVTICMDTRPTGSGVTALATEDGVIEIVVALAKHYLDREVPVSIVTGTDVTRIDPGDEAEFARFHSRTISLFFRSQVSPALLYEYHRSEAALSEGTVIFVTHVLDPEVFELVERSGGRSVHAAAIVDVAGLSDDERGRGELMKRSLRESGGELILVESADELTEELAQWRAPSA
jgi:uncharacterized protein (DUF58 family)